MKSFITFKRLLPAAIVAAAAAASLVQVAQAGPPPPSVPGPIQVLDGSKVFLIGHAVGVQIYSCNGTVWSSAVPRANLFDDHGKLIITHFAGPTWQAKDGSRVVGHAHRRRRLQPRERLRPLRGRLSLHERRRPGPAYRLSRGRRRSLGHGRPPAEHELQVHRGGGGDPEDRKH